MAHSWDEATGVLKALHKFKIGLGHVSLDHADEAEEEETAIEPVEDEGEVFEVTFTLRFAIDKPELDVEKFSNGEEMTSQLMNNVGTFLGVDASVPGTVKVDNVRAGSVIVDTVVAVADDAKATAAMEKLNGPDATDILDGEVFGAVEVSNVAKRVKGEEKEEAEEEAEEEVEEEEEEEDETPGTGVVTDGGDVFIDTSKHKKMPPVFPTTGKPTFNVSAPEIKVGLATPLAHQPINPRTQPPIPLTNLLTPTNSPTYRPNVIGLFGHVAPVARGGAGEQSNQGRAEQHTSQREWCGYGRACAPERLAGGGALVHLVPDRGGRRARDFRSDEQLQNAQTARSEFQQRGAGRAEGTGEGHRHPGPGRWGGRRAQARPVAQPDRG